MYNRYIPNGSSYTRIPMEDPPPPPEEPAQRWQPLQPEPAGEPAAPPEEVGRGGLGGLLKGLKLEGLDAGDILLLLIILFLFLEGDDMELVITLGLLLLLGLD